MKLSGNFLIAAVIKSLGEAMALVGKGGIDKRQYLDILTSTLFGAPVYKTYGRLIADGIFEPAGFAAPLGQKDIRLTLAAEDLRVPLRDCRESSAKQGCGTAIEIPGSTPRVWVRLTLQNIPTADIRDARQIMPGHEMAGTVRASLVFSLTR